MRKALYFVPVLTLAAFTLASAGNIQTLVDDCADCHGKNGLSAHSDVPIIAGQSDLVLEDALMAYAARDRECEQSEYRDGDTSRAPVSMCDIAEKLTEEDISAISMYFAELPFVPVKQIFDSALAERGALVHERNCEKCHTENGRLADDDAGILAGQWVPYLRAEMKDFVSGERPMSKKMAEKMKRIKAGDFEALLNFYASQIP